jgi:hypothetical protein
MGIPVESGALVTTIVAAISSLLIDHAKTVRNIHWAWRGTIVVAVATLLYLGSAVIADAFSHRFEKRIEGLWLEIFNEPPNENQEYSIAFIKYNETFSQIVSGGRGYTAAGELVSEWTCDTFVPNPRDNQCLLTYRGDIYNVAHDISGQGLMRFDPPSWVHTSGPFENGSGYFHEAYTKHEKVPYKLRRITPDMCQDMLGKHTFEQDDYPEFIRSYHRRFAGGN